MDPRALSVVPGDGQEKTMVVVKQTVVAALRLHCVSSVDEDYKALVGQCVTGTMFALRGKLRQGESVGMGEIGAIVEGLLEIFLRN